VAVAAAYVVYWVLGGGVPTRQHPEPHRIYVFVPLAPQALLGAAWLHLARGWPKLAAAAAAPAFLAAAAYRFELAWRVEWVLTRVSAAPILGQAFRFPARCARACREEWAPAAVAGGGAAAAPAGAGTGAAGPLPALFDPLPVPRGASPTVAAVLTATNHFAALGLEWGAGAAKVRAAKRALSLVTHPDKAGDAPGAAAACQRVLEVSSLGGLCRAVPCFAVFCRALPRAGGGAPALRGRLARSSAAR
jgi:hypothetical protein